MEALPPALVDPEWRAIVERVLKVWSAYQIGVEQESGGDDTLEKHVWLGDILADHVVNTRGLNADALADWIESILYQDFDLVLEDDSTFPTAHILLEAFRAFRSGDRVALTRVLSTLPSEATAAAARRASRPAPANGNDEEFDGEEEEDGESSAAEEEGNEKDESDKRTRERGPRVQVDEEGWATVKRR